MRLAEAELPSLVARLREGRGVRAKQQIRPVIDALGRCAGDVRNGDDCAVLPDSDGYTLFAAEGMLPGFVEREPEFAGFCAVMTNVMDIAAMGGRPRAIIDVLWAGEDPAQTRAILEGLAAAGELFGVPLVGGHTGRSTGGAHLCAAVLGKAQRLITSFAARPGELVLACIDLRGQFRPGSANFDAVSGARPERLRAQLELLPQLAEAGLVSAGKDISNAGLLGTLLMLLETSGCGARVDLAAVPEPEALAPDPQRWLEAFPSYGFLLTLPPSAADAVARRFHALGVAACPIAELCHGTALDLEYAGRRVRYWDLAREPLMGFTSHHGARHA